MPPLLRSKSLIMPDVQNPFKFELQMPWYRKIQIAVATVTILPLRVIFMCLCLLMAWFFASIILLGLSREEFLNNPITGWRKKLRTAVHGLVLGAFACAGIRWRIIGKQAKRTEASALILAPHSSFYDIGVGPLMSELPYAVSRPETLSIPIIGKVCLLCQPIFVYREDKDSRQKTIEELKVRAQSKGRWPQFLIFPEGTTTNRQALISFKAGAFIPGVPVQPVVIRYPDDWDTVTWTWEGPKAPILIWLCLCKLWTTLEIQFLPVYTPSEQERKDPYLFGDNVRKVMAKALGVPTTDHTFEDCRLMEYAKKANIKMADALIEFRKMQKKLGLSYDGIHDLLDRFSVMSNLSEGGGRVDLPTFSRYMGIPVNDTLKELFALYDRDGSGHIDFREYVIGMSLISEPASADEPVKLAFKLFDTNAKGYVTKAEFAELLLDMLETDLSNVNTLFDKVDTNGTGRVTFDDFKACAVRMPEYAALFSTYFSSKSNSNGLAREGSGQQTANTAPAADKISDGSKVKSE